MTSTNNTRVAKRKSFAKKTTGSFRVKNPNNNVVVNVRKEKIVDMGIPSDSLFVNMDDLDIIVRNVLVDGNDNVWAESIKIWEVETIVAILSDIHEVECNVTYHNEGTLYPQVIFTAPIAD